MGTVVHVAAAASRAGQDETVTFVETLLPDGVDAILCGGIEYVPSVEAAALPEGVNALRAPGGRVYVRSG